MKEKDIKAIERINLEIEKINKKENSIFFFVIDTKGNPSGSLKYIYKLAKIISDDGYKVTMLYQKEKEEEFVGVSEWLGNEYGDLPHADISSEDVSVSPSDILFIPEIFSNIMIQTKKLPCKRIMIFQNYNFMVEQLPISSQLGDLGIMDCITNSEANEKLLKDTFPYVKTNIIEPYIDDIYGTTKEPKELVINIISKNQENINKIIKPFYWKYPMYKWVSFRDLRGFPKESYSKYLRESAMTIWIDEDTSFGYGALEAIKSGSYVIAKTTDNIQKWMMESDNETYRNNCIWFDSYQEAHKMIASIVRAWITDKMPIQIAKSMKETNKLYSFEKTKNETLEYIESVINNRKTEMESLITQIKSQEENDR